MTTAEFEALNKEQCIALLPVSATEQHGPHLPVSVDAAINAGVLKRALGGSHPFFYTLFFVTCVVVVSRSFETLRERLTRVPSDPPSSPRFPHPLEKRPTELLPESVPLTCLPPVTYGKSVEHDDFAGTISLSVNTLIGVWTDIGESVARAGINKLIIFNSHGGQPQIMDIVARDLRKRFGMLVVAVNWFGFGLPDGLFDEDELKHGLHAGDVETSIMRHLHPELVNLSRAENFVSAGRDMEDTFKYLTPEGGLGFGWLAQDLHPSGATGDASRATATKGELCVEHAARRLVKLVEEVDDFDVDCVFNGGRAGEYCRVSFRKVWEDPTEKGLENDGERSRFKSHFTGME